MDWGKSYWDVLHFIAHNYEPDKQKDAVRNLFAAYMKGLLLCEKCVDHFNSMIAQYPLEPNLQSREQLSRYVNFLHNQVNKRLGKREVTWEQAEFMYKSPFIGYKRQQGLRTLVHLWGGMFLASIIMFAAY